MGNRGNLHDDSGIICRQWKLKAWITCQLEFKGRRRQIMSPGRYTELFFLDEVTALAAGHRPCAECRRIEYNLFKKLWLQENGDLLASGDIRIRGLDEVMHSERILVTGAKRMLQRRLAQIPDGVFVKSKDSEDELLKWNGHLWRWSPFGYRCKKRIAEDMEVRVLTPESIMKVIAGGYTPQVHHSANEFSELG